ncbi:hypothetical protein HKD37_13G035791 [Glycine soja]
MTAPTYCLVGVRICLKKKLIEEKRKKRQEEAMLTENTPLLEDPSSPIERHVKWEMARTKRYGQMTSEAAQEISDRIDSLQEQTTQGSFVPHGRDDILNTAIGRLKHPGHVRVAGSSTSITQQQLADIIGSLKEEWRNEIIENLKEEVRREIEEENKRSLEKLKHELKDALKIEFSQMGPQYSPFLEVDIQALGARVSTKGSNAEAAENPLGEEHDGRVIPTMGLYVQREKCNVLMALGKIYGGGGGPSNIHCMTNKSCETCVTGGKFCFESHISPKKLPEPVQRANNVFEDDPSRQLIKSLYDIYEKPVELKWDATKFGIPNVDASFFLTYFDVNEIKAGDKCLNIAILQLWMIHVQSGDYKCVYYVMHWMWNIISGGLKNDWSMICLLQQL